MDFPRAEIEKNSIPPPVFARYYYEVSSSDAERERERELTVSRSCIFSNVSSGSRFMRCVYFRREAEGEKGEKREVGRDEARNYSDASPTSKEPSLLY